MKTKNILIAAILVLSLFLFIYVVIFHQGLSSNHEEWGSFGSYIGGIGGIILSCSIFYYTYLIDKEHKQTEKNTHILKLIEVVGESISFLQRWKDLNFILSNEGPFEKGVAVHEQMKKERDILQTRIWTNYKTTQVLAKFIYGMDIPNVDELYKTETHFITVFNRIKKD